MDKLQLEVAVNKQILDKVLSDAEKRINKSINIGVSTKDLEREQQLLHKYRKDHLDYLTIMIKRGDEFVKGSMMSTVTYAARKMSQKGWGPGAAGLVAGEVAHQVYNNVVHPYPTTFGTNLYKTTNFGPHQTWEEKSERALYGEELGRRRQWLWGLNDPSKVTLDQYYAGPPNLEEIYSAQQQYTWEHINREIEDTARKSEENYLASLADTRDMWGERDRRTSEFKDQIEQWKSLQREAESAQRIQSGSPFHRQSNAAAYNWGALQQFEQENPFVVFLEGLRQQNQQSLKDKFSLFGGVGNDVLLGGGGGDGLFGGLTQGFEEATGRMRDNWEMMNTQMAGDTEACLGGISSQFGQTLGVDLGGQMTTLEQRFGQAAQGMSRQGSQSAKLIDLVFRRSLGQSIPGQMQALGHGWLGVLGRMGADNSQYFGGLEQLSQSVLGGQIPSQMQGLVGNWQGGVGSMEALGQRLFSYIELGAQETLGMVFSGEISNLGGLWDQVLSGMESTLVWLKRRTGEVRSALRQALKTNSPCFSPMAPILQP
jgi:hypothetical protein